jgi:hypothetical protein
MSNRVLYDTTRPKDQNGPPHRVGRGNSNDSHLRAYAGGWLHCADKVAQALKRGADYDDVERWTVELREWAERNDPKERQPEILTSVRK